MDLASLKIYILIAILAFGIIGAAVVYIKRSRLDREIIELEIELKKLLKKERLDRLRHADFEKFCEEVNAIRQKNGREPIPQAYLKKVQYNLMYSIDD
jgi:hypothetical protein